MLFVGEGPGFPSLRMAVLLWPRKEGMEKKEKQERAVQTSKGRRSSKSKGKALTEFPSSAELAL